MVLHVYLKKQCTCEMIYIDLYNFTLSLWYWICCFNREKWEWGRCSTDRIAGLLIQTVGGSTSELLLYNKQSVLGICANCVCHESEPQQRSWGGECPIFCSSLSWLSWLHEMKKPSGTQGMFQQNVFKIIF